MPIDPDQHAAVRDALDTADSLDASAVELAAEGDAVVLRGSVATFEEASAALSIAEHHADAVVNELRVDTNLREGISDAESAADDLGDDMQEALTENLPWDPPHEAVEVPTRAEERGVGDFSGDDDGAPAADGGDAKSLADLSPEELTRAARPSPRDEGNA